MFSTNLLASLPPQPSSYASSLRSGVSILIPWLGEGSFEESDLDNDNDVRPQHAADLEGVNKDTVDRPSFAPPAKVLPKPRVRVPPFKPLPLPTQQQVPQSALTRAHHAWSTAVNSRLGRTDNEKFLEHFRYTIVASQLLHEYLDHGSLDPSTTAPNFGLDGTSDDSGKPPVSTSLYGAAVTAAAALALACLINWLRSRRGGTVNKSRVALVLTGLAVAAFVGYAYIRRQWLQFLRSQAVEAASGLTSNWQTFELSSSSTLAFIQEVELVSKGYRLSTPLPPASRIEESGASRRCGKLRTALHKAYASIIPACIEACTSLRALIDEDDLYKYYEVYDINAQDAKEASGPDALSIFEDDAESLKSLRVLSYRAGVLRRVTLSSLMALEADGGKPDFVRWRVATDVMIGLNQAIATSAERVRRTLTEMEHFSLPLTPIKSHNTPAKEKMRSQVRKLSALSSGIRGLQAKMQILREETNKSIEQSDDLTDLGPVLMAQYESIGIDIRELMQAWDAGKQSLQTNITRHERRISMASSGLRSPVSSLGGLTAVEEGDGCPADALKVLNGEQSKSNRSSMAANSDEELVFEAVALPKQRTPASTLTREERIVKMHEERERQAQLRAKRDANTNMLRELESVINLRPKKTGNGAARITSI